MLKRYIKILLTVLIVISLSIASATAKDIEINIYSINDFHGALRPRADAPGISLLSGAMQELTSSTPNNIIVAAGDMFGTTTDAKDSDGISTVIAMNKLGIKYLSIGNHKFDYPPNLVAQQMRSADFPFMAANVSGGSNQFEKYRLITIDGVKIAIIGMITPETSITATKSNISDMEFLTPDKLLPKYIKEVRAQGADIVILLAHIGSKQAQDGAVQGEITQLLDKLQGVDAAITGHTHELVAGKYKNIPVVQAKCYGQAIAQLKIVYSTTNHKILSIEPRAIEVAKHNFQPDVQMGLFIQPYLDAATFKYNATIAINDQPLSNNRFKESTIADYFLDLVRKSTASDIVMLNGGAVRKDYVSQGPFTMANLIDIFPFANRMVKIKISGASILQALNHGIASPKYGFLRTSGLSIQYNSQLPSGQQVVKATLKDGKELQKDKYYTVVLPDFMLDGGDGYNMFNNYNSKELLSEIIEIILPELKKNPHITYTPDNRVTDINN